MNTIVQIQQISLFDECYQRKLSFLFEVEDNKCSRQTIGNYIIKQQNQLFSHNFD